LGFVGGSSDNNTFKVLERSNKMLCPECNTGDVCAVFHTVEYEGTDKDGNLPLRLGRAIADETNLQNFICLNCHFSWTVEEWEKEVKEVKEVEGQKGELVWSEEDLVVYITVKDVQERAVERIGRRLTDEEMQGARKGITEGIMFDSETVLDSAIDMVTEDKGGDKVEKR
jgi:hypothetical protein